MVRRAPLWLHAGLLGVVLLCLMPLAGGASAIVSADEGAMLAQLDLVERTGSWSAPNPAPVVDPELRALPLELSERSVDGRWSPFAKHVAHIAILRLPYGLAGFAGTIATSLVAVALAAWAAGAIADRVRPGTGVVTVWLVGLGSPLAFDGHLVLGHAIGASAAGLAGLLAVRIVDAGPVRFRALHVAGLVMAVGAASLLRSEAVLLGVALGASLLVAALVRSRGTAAIAGAGAILAAIGARELDRRLIEWALGGESTGTSSTSVAAAPLGFLEGRWQGFEITMLRAGYGVEGGEIYLLLSTVVLAAGVLVARSRPGLPLAPVAWAAAALAVMRLATTEFLVPGLLMATPALLAGLLALRTGLLREPGIAVLAGTSAVFAAAVVLTQYDTGGTGEWGGRYFAVGLPLALPVAVASLADLAGRLDRRERRHAGAALGVMSLALLIGAVQAVSVARDGAASVLALTEEAIESADVVVSTAPGVGRVAWELAPSARFHSTSSTSWPSLRERLADQGVDRLALITRDVDADVPRLGPFVETARTERGPLALVVLERSERNAG